MVAIRVIAKITAKTPIKGKICVKVDSGMAWLGIVLTSKASLLAFAETPVSPVSTNALSLV